MQVIKNILNKMPIIHPQSRFLQMWDFIHSAFIIINLVLSPIEVAANTHFNVMSENILWDLYSYILIMIFVIDIIINFNTGFYLRGVLVKERNSIITNYFKRGLMWDIFAILPLMENILIFTNVFRALNIFVLSKYMTLRYIIDKYIKLF